jgi:hypothetical protein
MRVMEVPIMQIVGVTFVLNSWVAAILTVGVVVLLVGNVSHSKGPSYGLCSRTFLALSSSAEAPMQAHA